MEREELELCFPTTMSSSYSEVCEREKHLPIANVTKIMKIAVPNKFKISKEAKHTVQICVSEFISFITNEANDRCMKEKRKAITGEHVLWAISTLGFEDYVEPLKLYLRKYRKMEGGARALAKEGGVAATQVPPTT